MRINPLKTRLAAGLPCRGVWLALASPNSARLLARLPIDWAVVDAEHTPMDDVTLYRMVTGIAEAAGPAPVVRVAQLAVENFKRALDAGAYGVIAPMVNTRPKPSRQWPGPGSRPRACAATAAPSPGWPSTPAEPSTCARPTSSFWWACRSKAAALANLDDIFSTPGLDLGFVGPVDLSISLGLEPLPENPHPLFQEAIAEILRAGAAHHLPLGMYCSSGAAAAERIRQGFLFVNVADDFGLIQKGLQAELDASMA